MRLATLLLFGLALGCDGSGTAPVESGDATLDAGTAPARSDAGTVADLPSGPLDPVIPCSDEPSAIYATPSDLPVHTAALRGEIVACTTDRAMPVDMVQARMSGAAVLDVSASSAVRVYRVSYRTEREPGVAALGTAIVMLPDTPRPGTLPVIVAAHGTAGLADMCAPSMIPFAGDDLILPWAASGYPVVAPDYAGLGNQGTQGYGHQADTSHSVLDAARALHALLGDEPRLSREVILAGHSQGGGAVQAAQAFGPSYLEGDLEVVRVISFAGGLPAQDTALGLFFAIAPITGGAGVTRSVVALNLYATFDKLFGPEHASDAFHPDLRSTITDAIETQCIFLLTTTLATPTANYVVPNTLGDILDPDFQQEALECTGGGACSTRVTAYRDHLEGNVIPLADSRARVLLLGGGMDVQQTPASQACTHTALDGAGIENEICQYPTRTHFDIVASSIGYAMTWAADPTTPCPETPTLPVCATP